MTTSSSTKVCFCGPNQQWVAWSDEEVLGTSRELPIGVRATIQALTGNDCPKKRMGLGGPDIIAYGSNGGEDAGLWGTTAGDATPSSFICFTRGRASWNYLGAAFATDVTKFKFLDVVALGPRGSYIVSGTAISINGNTSSTSRVWRGVPDDVEQFLRPHRPPLEVAALGAGGNFYIQYKRGRSSTNLGRRSCWGGEIADVLGPLVSGVKDVAFVSLSSFDASAYYVRYEDGSCAWNGGGHSLSAALKSDIEYMDIGDIFYINDSISDHFTCGTSIYKTADDLKTGKITAEDIPPIEVVKFNGSFYTLSHRRLWAFKIAALVGVPVKRVDMPPNTRSRIKRNPEKMTVQIRGHC